jgi:hypothetical protein
MHHSFEVEDAIKFGQEEALVLHAVRFWIAKNEASQKNYHDGRYWTYNTYDSWAIIFPYWTKKQVERIVKSLIAQGALITGNYNDSPYDKTTWYALNDRFSYAVHSINPNGSIEDTKRDDRSSQTVSSSSTVKYHLSKHIQKEVFSDSLHRVRKLFSKRDGTSLDANEKRAWKAAKEVVEATHEDDWKALEEFFEKSDKQYLKRTMATLLNQWNGEIDRAKAWRGIAIAAPTKAPEIRFETLFHAERSNALILYKNAPDGQKNEMRERLSPSDRKFLDNLTQ